MIEITETEFNKLAEYIKANCGIHLKAEKQALVTGRLHNELVDMGFRSFSEYFNHIVVDKTGIALNNLIEKITTNHTFFMREVDHFDYLKEKVLPVLAHSVLDKDLRIWSAGCSTGEEPYTIAIIIDEFFGTEKKYWDTKILATDISNRVLTTGQKGLYHAEKMANLPTTWKLKYFSKVDCEHFLLSEEIRSEVLYRKFNLMENSFPFKKRFHVIFCRNVMIYFDSSTREKLVEKFYNSLEPGGYLFIGHSESLNREKMKFKYVKPAVYRKE